MNPVSKLHRSARESTKARGHKRIAWDKPYNQGKAQDGTCLDCLMWVRLDTAPMPNGIDISGSAVALNCTGKDRTLERIADGYLECAAWASTQSGRTRHGRRDDKPLEDFQADWTQGARLEARKLAQDFYTSNAEDCESYFSKRGAVSDGSSAEECLGHDLFLTRNGHGTGFWDRGLGELGDRLSKAAKVYGSHDCYVHKGRIYFQ
jgi:hypothetical protein